MPTLDWIGKQAVVNHHREVPYRLVHCDGALSAGDAEAGNLLVQGDNLEALRALLPYYAGKVKCIYIDPPYNTGNEGWIYNDNVNSPEIKAWLGKVVGKEAEDLSRHDKWLCMIYPRLRLLREFLREDGAIFLSIDDNEYDHLKAACDEIFGRQNFYTTFIWQKVDSPNDNKVPVTPDHEYVLCYARSIRRAAFKKKSDESILDSYRSTEEEPRLHRDRLIKKNGKNSLREDRPTMFFELTAPDGSTVFPIHDDGREANWAFSAKGIEKLKAEGRLVWKKRETESGSTWIPYAREFAPESPERPHPTILLDVKTSRQAKAHQTQLFPEAEPFPTVKPEQLIQRLLAMSTDPNDLVLDSFLGSGTTAAVAMKMERRFIGVEMGEHAVTHCAPRLKKVIDGEDGGISDALNWEGGSGFRFCRLGTPLFDEFGDVAAEVTFPDLAAHIFFSETGVPIPAKAKSELLGTYQGKSVYLLFDEASAGAPRAAAGNVLTPERLAKLPKPPKGFEGVRVIYAEGCTVSAARLNAAGAVFKQIPYQVEGAGR